MPSTQPNYDTAIFLPAVTDSLISYDMPYTFTETVQMIIQQVIFTMVTMQKIQDSLPLVLVLILILLKVHNLLKLLAQFQLDNPLELEKLQITCLSTTVKCPILTV